MRPDAQSSSIHAGVALLPLPATGACKDDDVLAVPAAAPAPPLPPALDALKASLAPYVSLTRAKNAGYDTANTDCLSNGDEGAMGIHFARTDLIDGTMDEGNPAALIYEPGTNGEMSLVGAEFIVPFTRRASARWRASSTRARARSPAPDESPARGTARLAAPFRAPSVRRSRGRVPRPDLITAAAGPPAGARRRRSRGANVR